MEVSGGTTPKSFTLDLCRFVLVHLLSHQNMAIIHDTRVWDRAKKSL